MSIGKRIAELRGKASRKAFAGRIGIIETTLRNYETEQSLPNSKVIANICREFNISFDWLMTGAGPMRSGDETLPPAEALQRTALAAEGVEMLLIPMADAVLSAGRGSLETGAESSRKYAFPADFLRRKGNPASMALMRVDGDSMEPEIKSGDVVLIDQSQTALRPGKMYAVGVEEMVFIKIASAMPGKVILHSLNSGMYPPLEVDTRGDLEGSVRIVGRCVWSCREL